MEMLGQWIINLMMVSLVIGAIAYVIKPESALGGEFKEGILTIGHIFIPIAGVMTLIPVLVPLIEKTITPIYLWAHSDPAIAVNTFIPADLGAYHLGHAVAASHDAWILSATIGMTSGATIAFIIPVGLAMLDRRDHKYMALGIMCGFLAIPFASMGMALFLAQTGVPLREDVGVDGASTRPFDLPFTSILLNLMPLVVVMVVLALCLRFLTKPTISAFLLFGKAIHIVTTLAVALSVVEYFTGFFSGLFGSWPLAPFIADGEDQMRALEVCGAIAIMLAGAFPLIHLVRTVLNKPFTALGTKVGVSEAGIAGFLAVCANAVAMLRMVGQMPPKDKVLVIAFGTCTAFMVGDYLSFTANFQPNMIIPMIVGKLIGGVVAVLLAFWLALPHARRLAEAVGESYSEVDPERVAAYEELEASGEYREDVIAGMEDDYMRAGRLRRHQETLAGERPEDH